MSVEAVPLVPATEVKAPSLVVADTPISTTKALLLSVLIPRVHRVYVPPSAEDQDHAADTVRAKELSVDEGPSDASSKIENKIGVVDAVKKNPSVTVIVGKDPKNCSTTKIIVRSGGGKADKTESDAAGAVVRRKDMIADVAAGVGNRGTASDDSNGGEDDNIIGYVEGDKKEGEEAVEHVVTAEEMATVVKIPTVPAEAESSSAPSLIRNMFGMMDREKDGVPTIELSRAEAMDAMKREGSVGQFDIPDGLPNTEIRVDALLRILFKDLLVEGHLFNAPFYKSVDITSDDKNEQWLETCVLVKAVSIGTVLERLERIGVGLRVGTLAIFKSEMCRTAYDYTVKSPAVSDSPIGSNAIVNDKSKSSRSDTDTKASTQAAKAEWKNAASRLRIEQVKEQIQEQAQLSFDFLALVCIASVLAGIGLITDSTVVIVASMLVSPIMGPVMGCTFGSRVSDWSLVKSSCVNECIALLICIVIGMAIGFAASWTEGAYDWPTEEMSSRGDTAGFITGIAIAVPSGMGVCLSILGNNTSALVGVAISASLLPPAVNAGICWARAILISSGAVPNSLEEDFGRIGGVSFGLTIINVICIWLAGMLMFAIKEVAPIKTKSAFWARDIKVARTQQRDGSRKETSDIDLEVVRAGLRDAIESERKTRGGRGGVAATGRRKLERALRHPGGSRTAHEFNLAARPLLVADISAIDSERARSIGLDGRVDPVSVATGQRYANDPVYVSVEDMEEFLENDSEKEPEDDRPSTIRRWGLNWFNA